MPDCICKVVNGRHLEFDNFVPGITSINVNPSSAKGYNTGTITISAYAFDKNTGPYLLSGGGSYCEFVRIQGQLNWILKLKCSQGKALSNIEVPGDEPDDGYYKLIPQLQSPVVIETGDGSLPNLPSPYIFEVSEDDLLNTTSGSSANLIPSYNLDGSSGPSKTFSKAYRREYKWINFRGLHDLFTFNTKTVGGNIDVASEIVIKNVSSIEDTFQVYPQSFSLIVEPPKPATITFTFTYVDNNKNVLELDGCS